MKKAFVFYAWFQGPNDNEPFIARVLDNTTNPRSWRIDNHDKTYIFAIVDTFIREATDEETYNHINRKSVAQPKQEVCDVCKKPTRMDGRGTLELLCECGLMKRKLC